VEQIASRTLAQLAIKQKSKAEKAMALEMEKDTSRNGACRQSEKTPQPSPRCHSDVYPKSLDEQMGTQKRADSPAGNCRHRH